MDGLEDVNALDMAPVAKVGRIGEEGQCRRRMRGSLGLLGSASCYAASDAMYGSRRW